MAAGNELRTVKQLTDFVTVLSLSHSGRGSDSPLINTSRTIVVITWKQVTYTNAAAATTTTKPTIVVDQVHISNPRSFLIRVTPWRTVSITVFPEKQKGIFTPVSYTHLDVYKRQHTHTLLPAAVYYYYFARA